MQLRLVLFLVHNQSSSAPSKPGGLCCGRFGAPYATMGQKLSHGDLTKVRVSDISILSSEYHQIEYQAKTDDIRRLKFSLQF